MRTGFPRSLPFAIVPGTRHRVVLWFVARDGTTLDRDGETWEMTLHDAVTGTTVGTYDVDLDGNRIEFVLDAETTGELDELALYEARITRLDPGPDLIFAGPILFRPPTLRIAA